MELNDTKNDESVIYEPNNRIIMGFGFSYRAFTLNLGFGFSFLNQNDQELGKTSYFDAQGNVYMKKVATNLFFLTYQGYYLDSHSREEIGLDPVGDSRAFRRDIRQSTLGFSSVYIFNNDKFSYRASFTQDAWQKKSAGSWLAGGYATYFTVRGDSSLIPTALDSLFENTLQIKQGNFVDIGLQGGGVYTLVIGKHFFATISGVVGFGASIVKNGLEIPPDNELEQHSKVGPGYSIQARYAMGYNSKRNYFGFSYNNETSWSAQSESDRFGWSVGNFRLNFAHRFNTRVVILDKIFDGVSYNFKN